MRLKLREMGKVLRIEYIGRDGKRYVHEFKKRPKLGATPDGSALVITPVRATRWIKDAK